MDKPILITGAIGSGKTEVSKYLRSKGFPVYDSDSRAKALYSEVPGLAESVEKALGVPLSGLSVIFSDRAKREKLESLLYPHLLADMNGWVGAQNAPLVFIESAIALEKPAFDDVYGKVWLVDAPLQQRMERNPKVAERSASQAPADRSRADAVIENDSTIEGLHRKIDKILNDTMKTDLSKIISVAGQHGLFRFLALSRNNSVIAEALADGRRTVFDSRSRVTTLSDIAIYTSEGELKLKEVFLALDKALAGGEAPASKGDDAAVKALFAKAVPNYDADRFYVSHMRKILDWFKEIVKHASLDFVEEEENAAEEAPKAE